MRVLVHLMNDADGDDGSGNGRVSLASSFSSSRKRDHRRQDVAHTAVGNGTTVEDETNEEMLFMEALLNPNFDELSRQFRYFQKVYNTKNVSTPTPPSKKKHLPVAPYITPEFTMALSRALLHVHFGLSLTVDSDGEMEPHPAEAVSPSRFLCPPIPNRFFYVQWIVRTLLPLLPCHNLFYFEPSAHLQRSSSLEQQPAQARSCIYGLDIGTGATCIYPLLMTHYNKKRQHSLSKGPIIVMHATDIDPVAVRMAEANVNANQLQSFVHVHLVPKSDRQLLHNGSFSDRNNTTTHTLRDGSSSGIPMDVDPGENDSLVFPFLQNQSGPLIRSLEQIQVFHKQSLDAASNPKLQFDFVMANPPFYDSNASNTAQLPINGKDGMMDHFGNHLYDPKTQSLQGRTTLMTVHEGYYPYGEIGFGLDLILDSWNLFVLANAVASPLQFSANSSPLPPLPHWISMMCGKKSSFDYLHHAISQLLGPSHVCTTEFGPGEYTRWFIAWTYHRPLSRSPLARMNREWNFDVSIIMPPSSTTSASDSESVKKSACQEVANRFVEYSCNLTKYSEPGVHVICEEIENLSSDDSNCRREQRFRTIMRLRMYEQNDPLASSAVSQSWLCDETLPDCLKSCIQKMNSIDRKILLPSDCGHYLLDITLSIDNAKDVRSSDVKSSTMNLKVDHQHIVHVEIVSYRHSMYGQKRIEKIRSQLENEICRTSRRWRRLLQRQQPPDEQKSRKDQRMDES